jgi:hypothetical protein
MDYAVVCYSLYRQNASPQAYGAWRRQVRRVVEERGYYALPAYNLVVALENAADFDALIGEYEALREAFSSRGVYFDFAAFRADAFYTAFYPQSVAHRPKWQNFSEFLAIVRRS